MYSYNQHVYLNKFTFLFSLLFLKNLLQLIIFQIDAPYHHMEFNI
jgi:hypothetical protein